MTIFQILRPEAITYTQHWVVNFPSTAQRDELLKLIAPYKYELVPNVRTFNIVLKGLRKFGSKSFIYTQNILDDMIQASIKPDPITINTIVDIGVSSGYLESAAKVEIIILLALFNYF